MSVQPRRVPAAVYHLHLRCGDPDRRAYPQVLEHTAHCPVRAMAAGDEACTCGTGGPKVTDDNPYRDVEYARSLVKRAEALAPENSVLARFLLELATEARLLAELQGKWEY